MEKNIYFHFNKMIFPNALFFINLKISENHLDALMHFMEGKMSIWQIGINSVFIPLKTIDRLGKTNFVLETKKNTTKVCRLLQQMS